MLNSGFYMVRVLIILIIFYSIINVLVLFFYGYDGRSVQCQCFVTVSGKAISILSCFSVTCQAVSFIFRVILCHKFQRHGFNPSCLLLNKK